MAGNFKDVFHFRELSEGAQSYAIKKYADSIFLRNENREKEKVLEELREFLDSHNYPSRHVQCSYGETYRDGVSFSGDLWYVTLMAIAERRLTRMDYLRLAEYALLPDTKEHNYVGPYNVFRKMTVELKSQRELSWPPSEYCQLDMELYAPEHQVIRPLIEKFEKALELEVKQMHGSLNFLRIASCRELQDPERIRKILQAEEKPTYNEDGIRYGWLFEHT